MPLRSTMATLSLIALASTASGQTTRTVCASGCHYTSINAAIDDSSDGDIIQLSAETYTERGTIEMDTDIELTIIGEVDSAGDPATIISGDDSRQVMNITGGSLRFQDLQIAHGSETGVNFAYGGGARIEDAHTSFVNCWIVDNYASAPGAFGQTYGQGGGLYVSGTGSLLLERCRFQGNSAPKMPALGVVRDEGLRVEIIDCMFTTSFGIKGDDDDAIWLTEEAPIPGDLDGDGDYDEDDARIAMADFGITEGTPGDMDGDDDVDAADFVAVRDQVGVETLGCLVADINGDGIVNGADFSYVLGYWGLCSAP